MAETGTPQPRIILNDDASNFLYCWDDVGAEDLRTYLSRLEGTQVDMVAYCVAFGGYVTYYESDVAEPVGTGFSVTDRVKQLRWAHNRARLREEAGDYIGLVFRTLGEMGIPALASLRMNDAHMSGDPVGPVAGRFWMNHPEWRLGEPFGYYASCLDYAQAPVREYLRRLVLEVVEKFPDIAGIELDGMRSPFFFHEGEGEANAPVMTGFIARLREDLDDAARRRGRERYLLRVNVPRSPELALECGLDVAAWAEQGLVDGIAPGSYATDFQIPIERWRDAVGEMPVHAYLNCSPAMGVYMSLEDYRGAAANAWAAGADGIYMFNLPCLDELSFLTPVPVDREPFPPPEFASGDRHPDISRSRRALNEIGDPELLAGRDKRFLFFTDTSRCRHAVPERAELDRFNPRPVDLTWRCYEDFEQAALVRVELKLVGVTIRDEFAFSINGHSIEPERVERLHASNGRDARVHGISLDPYSLYSFELRAEELRRGENV
ncbi:MAG: hypothetical protein J7M38_00830, partial [Armatimonadetes bacterium]|nr:hypothetical protein [Armatimonadota bacterium]